MLGPCCLCAFKSGGERDFVESAIYMVGHGRHAGEYVAACAIDECGYFGKRIKHKLHDRMALTGSSVFMERVYFNRGLPIRRYALRG
jgi:hypothetical protein